MSKRTLRYEHEYKGDRKVVQLEDDNAENFVDMICALESITKHVTFEIEVGDDDDEEEDDGGTGDKPDKVKEREPSCKKSIEVEFMKSYA